METHGPVEEAYVAQLNALASVIEQVFNGEAKGKDRKVGFALLLFDFGDSKRMNYISNAQRADMLCAMREFIAHAEGRVINTETREQ